MTEPSWQVSLGYFAIGTGALTVGAVWLAKAIVTQLPERDLKAFEKGLQDRNDKELARLNADLRVTAFERETQFSKLHERRAEFIAGLYDKLQYFCRTIEPLTLAVRFEGQRSDEDMQMLSPGQDRADVRKKAWETVNKAIPPVLEALETQFRQMLGDKKPSVGE